MKIIITILFFLPSVIIDSTDYTVVNRTTAVKMIRDHVDCAKKSKLILVFLSIGECMKCGSGISETIDSVSSLYTDPLCLVIAVRCSREVELKVFSNNYGWTGSLYMDDGSLKKDLGLPEYTRIAVYNVQNIFMGSLRREDFDPTAYHLLDSLLQIK